ncbi:MAG: formylglycine-generating enzyme family protein [Planctomycetes bacterium]|nr:formylglycine-generating enzyme family protein [Planctomycetota bacterium]
MKKLVLLGSAFAYLFLASCLHADTVVMKDGRRLEGKVIDKGETIELRTGATKTLLDRSEVARVERKKAPYENIEFFGLKARPPIKNGTDGRKTCEQIQVEMVYIPSGEVPIREAQGGALRKVHVRAFLMDRTEVTNAQYALFLKHVAAYGDTACAHPEQPVGKDHTPAHWDDPKFNQPRQPVVGVDWYDAYAFAKWAGKRLPTREEWRLAAGVGSVYPWGNDPQPNACNHGSVRMLDSGERKLYTDSSDGFVYAAPSASFASDQSPYGCLDMAGNVSEWTATLNAGRACRCGGNMCQPAELCRNRTYRFMERSLRSFTTGFRCATDAE